MANSKNKIFGLAINNTSLTAVEISHGKFGPKVTNYSRIEFGTGIIEDRCIIVNPEVFQDTLRKLLLNAKNGPIKTKDVVISIPEEKTFTHQLEIPKEYRDDDDYINDKAKDFIPIALDEAIIDYKIIKNKNSDKILTLNYVATQKSIVNMLIQSLKEVGLNVVGVDTNKNSLIRACNNQYNKNDGDFAVMYLNSEKIVLSITTESGTPFHTNIKNIGSNELCEFVKNALQLPGIKDAEELINKFKKDINSVREDQRKMIGKKLQEEFLIIIKKFNELKRIVENNEDLNLKTIYIIGQCSGLPGLMEAVKAENPDAQIKQKLEYIEIDENTETYYPHAIGLALKNVFETPKGSDINLLPNIKKEEIETERATPIFKRYFIGTTLLLGCLMVFFGTMAGRYYMDFNLSDRNITLLNEKTMNPYLNDLAKSNQEKTLLKNGIKTVLKDAVPGSLIMKSIDSYNTDETGIINANLRINSSKQTELILRAKTTSRKATEDFIIELEQNPYFLQVNSPLSNLVGKGERFINIDLILDTTNIIESFEENRIDQEKQVTKELESGVKEETPKPKFATTEDKKTEENTENDKQGETPANNEIDNQT
ncbi:pilus assembly protein PilM [Candidatus Peregrinibacteria bacterium]|nr:pilus assembly protein PilM [Candidatus Peregrinibacteria bacterium]